MLYVKRENVGKLGDADNRPPDQCSFFLSVEWKYVYISHMEIIGSDNKPSLKPTLIALYLKALY